jgi:hypothetical protein
MNRRSPRAPWRPDSGFYVAYAQLKPRRPFDGQVAGLRTLKDPVYKIGGAAEGANGHTTSYTGSGVVMAATASRA